MRRRITIAASVLLLSTAIGCEEVRLRPDLEEWERGPLDDLPAEPRHVGLDALHLSGPAKAEAIAAGFYNTCAALEDGRVVCFGDNRAAFDADETQADLYVVERISDVDHLTLGKRRGCAWKDGDALRCWPARGGREGFPSVRSAALGGGHHCAVFGDAGHVRCIGDDGWLQSQSRFSSRRWWVQGVEGAAEVATGATHTCARHEDGTVTCWGDNRQNQMGDGSDRVRARPARVPGLTGIRQIASNSMAVMTCALDADGVVTCWGAYGVARAGGTTALGANGERLSVLAGVEKIAVGPWEVCALTSGGEVHCYRQSLTSARGDGGPVFGEPMKMRGIERAADVAVGAMHACALFEAGNIACWGSNTYGQLGTERQDDQRDPVLVTALDALHEAAGTEDGT